MGIRFKSSLTKHSKLQEYYICIYVCIYSYMCPYNIKIYMDRLILSTLVMIVLSASVVLCSLLLSLSRNMP